MTSKQIYHQLLILGSGPAGCAASVYAARAGLDFLMLTGNDLGGQLIKTAKVGNWPGMGLEISGVDLMLGMLKQLELLGVERSSDQIVNADLSVRPFVLQGTNHEYCCDALIIATGTLPRLLGIPGEKQYLGKGVSTCATCDGFFYKDKQVAVIGGGNSMAETALYLAPFAKQVTVIHRSEKLRVEEYLKKRLEQHDQIKLELNSIATKIIGDDHKVVGLEVERLDTKVHELLPVSGVFLAVGQVPDAAFFVGQLAMDNGFIKTGYEVGSQTSVAGVFAAGDIVFKNHRQAIVAAGSGASAALDAKKFLSNIN